MSIRTIVEFNNDHLRQLLKQGCINRKLYDYLLYPTDDRRYELNNSVTFLVNRHHSDPLTIKMGDIPLFDEK